MKLSTFIEKEKIRFDASLTDSNPHMSDMMQGSTHWLCRIRRGRRSMKVYFSQGPAIRQEPTAEDVLDCLASDASGFDNASSFEDWCAEYGLDSDSRKAEKTYRAIEFQRRDLVNLLGGDAYRALLECERL